MNRETAERATILRGLVGSTVHGLNVNDGIEDRDEMGVCVEPFEAAMSLREPFVRIPAKLNADSEDAERGFRASRTRLGAERRVIAVS
jgi:hypothetical protein